MADLGGVLVALSTPFDAESKVDEKGLRRHVDFVIENGVHGIVPCGSTGEVAALTFEERKRITEIVIEQTAGRVPVVPQTGSTSTAESVELTRHAEQAGAAAVLVVAPYYEPPTREEVIEHYGAIGDATSLPIVTYNLPEVTGTNLDVEFYRDLAKRTDKVKYAKDTSGSMEQAVDLIFNLEGQVKTFVGLDTILLPSFLIGSAGTITGAPNVAPRETVEMWNAVQEGRLEDAKKVFRQTWKVMNFLGVEGYAASTKEAAGYAGIDIGAPRAPYGKLPAAKSEELKALVEEAGLTY